MGDSPHYSGDPKKKSHCSLQPPRKATQSWHFAKMPLCSMLFAFRQRNLPYGEWSGNTTMTSFTRHYPRSKTSSTLVHWPTSPTTRMDPAPSLLILYLKVTHLKKEGRNRPLLSQPKTHPTTHSPIWIKIDTITYATVTNSSSRSTSVNLTSSTRRGLPQHQTTHVDDGSSCRC